MAGLHLMWPPQQQVQRMVAGEAESTRAPLTGSRPDHWKMRKKPSLTTVGSIRMTPVHVRPAQSCGLIVYWHQACNLEPVTACRAHAVDDGIALRTMDIFAGCGGLSEGFQQAGAAICKWAVEYEHPAAGELPLTAPLASVAVQCCLLTWPKRLWCLLSLASAALGHRPLHGLPAASARTHRHCPGRLSSCPCQPQVAGQLVTADCCLQRLSS